MTDPSRDDLASAVLDGLLGDEETTNALRDPAVARRVEEMRAVRSLLQPAPPVDAARRERSIAAALAAADAAGGPGAGAGPGSHAGVGHAEGGATHGAGPPPTRQGAPVPLDDLADRRRPGAARRTAARRTSAARWLPAAAVILVVLAIAGLIAGSGTSSSDSDMAADSSSDEASQEQSSTAAPDAPSGEAEASGDAGAGSDAPLAEPEASADAPAASEATRDQDAAGDDAAPPGVESLGAFATLDELAGAAGTAARGLPSTTGAEAQGSPETFADADGCETPAAARSAGVTTVLLGEATLAGAPVRVWVLDGPGGRRLVVVDRSCTVVDDRLLPAG
jgi:hypothetical protein